MPRPAQSQLVGGEFGARQNRMARQEAQVRANRKRDRQSGSMQFRSSAWDAANGLYVTSVQAGGTIYVRNNSDRELNGEAIVSKPRYRPYGNSFTPSPSS